MIGIRGCKTVVMACLLWFAAAAHSATVIHVKNPWPGQPMWTGLRIISSLIAGPPGAAMTDDGDGWFSYSFPDNLPANTPFHIVMYPPASYDATQPDYGNEKDFFANGIVKTGTEFTLGVMRGIGSDVWIIPLGTGAPTITDIPQAKKVAFIFNPWPANAPQGKVGNATTFSTLHQSPDPARCGWYGAYYNAAPYTVSYKSLFGTETYGIGGMNDNKPIDLSSYFATADTIYLTPDPIPGGAPKITTTIPAGVTGTCSFELGVTVRDFSIQHPDFEKADMKSDVASLGMVAATLDSNGKPQVGPKPYIHQSDFYHWFRDDPNPTDPTLKNYTYCRNLKMTKGSNGLWGYNSFKSEPSHSFFPIDDANEFHETAKSQYIDPTDGTVHNDPTNADHNFSFCMEMHASFKYEQGQVFNFVGDDDTWAFINGRLVMDLGGPHPPLPGSVKLDTMKDLVPGTDYPFDFFFCERHTTGSDLAVETSIFFEQQQSVFAKPTVLPDSSIQYEIYEIISGDKSCGATKDGVTQLAPSSFRLSGPSANPPVDLPIGNSYGGININPATNTITVNTNKITGLRAGTYIVTYTTQSGKGSTLQFIVPGKYALDFLTKNPVNQILGTSVPVTIQATNADTADQRAALFHLTAAAGLLVFTDSAQTTPITAATDLRTVTSNGQLKVYVTSQTEGTYKLDLYDSAKVLEDTYNNLRFFKQPKVEKPAASPPGQIFILPIGVALSTPTVGASIFYTTDGSDPATSATGTTQLYSAAIPLTATTTIKAIAIMAGWINSDIMTESYTYTAPLKIVKSFYRDADGDGRIESVEMDFEKDLPALPTKLTFTLKDATGADVAKDAGAGEIAFAPGVKNKLIITFAQPFPYGITSVTGNPNVSGHIYKQDNIPSLDGSFPVDDSVAPVITRATVFEPDSIQPLKHVLISLSEGVADIPRNSQTAFVFKRDGQEMNVKISGIEKSGDHDYTVYIDTTSTAYPIVGDSVALGTDGQVKDVVGNIPHVEHFLALDGVVPKPKPMNMYVTFPNSRADKPVDGMEPQGDAVFIPVDQSGTALTGDPSEGKCTGVCFAGTNESFVGPVFHIETPGPMTYEFTIFNNVGEFVTKGKGILTQHDLDQMKPINGASGVKYQVRVVWTGRTATGAKAATGAYILQSTLTSEKDPRTGAGPGKETKRVVFGMLRSFRGS